MKTTSTVPSTYIETNIIIIIICVDHPSYYLFSFRLFFISVLEFTYAHTKEGSLAHTHTQNLSLSLSHLISLSLSLSRLSLFFLFLFPSKISSHHPLHPLPVLQHPLPPCIATPRRNARHPGTARFSGRLGSAKISIAYAINAAIRSIEV